MRRCAGIGSLPDTGSIAAGFAACAAREPGLRRHSAVRRAVRGLLPVPESCPRRAVRIAARHLPDLSAVGLQCLFRILLDAHRANTADENLADTDRHGRGPRPERRQSPAALPSGHSGKCAVSQPRVLSPYFYLFSTFHIIATAAARNASVGAIALNSGGQALSSPRCPNRRLAR